MSTLPSYTNANPSTPYFALANGAGSVSNWSAYPAVSTINVSSNAITNVSSLQIDAQVLTANASSLFLNGVPIATIPDISNVEDWALYPALANVDMDGHAVVGATDISSTSAHIGALTITGMNGDLNLSGNAITNAASVQVGNRTLTTTAGTANAPYLLLNGSNILSNWSSFTAGTAVSMGVNDINNVKDITSSGTIQANAMTTNNLTLSTAVITTLGSSVLVNGLNNTSNWAAYQANASLDMAGYPISHTPEISISGTTQNVVLTASGTQLLVDGQPVSVNDVSGWANYPAVANVDMSGFAISGTPSITISGTTQNVVLTALATALLVDGQPVYTGPLPPSTTSNWSLYPAISAVNMSGHDILGNGDLRISANNINLDAGSNINLTKTATTKSIEMTGNMTQCNAGAGSNYFQSGTQIGSSGVLPTDQLGTLAIYGGNVPTGLSTLYVKGGTTLDGTLTHGHTIGCLPAAGINTQRIDVLPVGITMLTPTFITMNGAGAANIAMGGAVALAAGSYITLEHNTGLGQNGIFVQNAARDSNARLVMTGGGTLYNATQVQASNIVNPLGIRFYNGVYNPSGGSIVVPPVYGRAIVDLSGTSYLATLTGGDLPATNKNSNSVFVGNFPSLTTTGAVSTIAIGNTTGMSGQSAGAIAIGEDAGSNSQGVEAVAIGSSAGASSQGTNAVAIGNTAGFVSQRENTIAIGTNAGYSGQLSNSIVIGAGAGSNGCGAESIAIGTNAGASNHGTWSIAVGSNAGQYGQGNGAVSIGLQCGLSGQGVNALAIGNVAGYSNQGQYAVALGLETGQYGQGANAVAIGWQAGQSNQQTNAVAIGYGAGLSNQLADSVCIGTNAGGSNHGQRAIAIGSNAGLSSQGSNSVAIGTTTGQNGQGIESVAIGLVAGFNNQGTDAVAVGAHSGEFSQTNFGTAVGYYAGHTGQGYAATGIGVGAGFSGQGSNSVAVGFEAGNTNLGTNSVAIGYGASSNGGSFSNTIVLNATGAALNPAQASSTYIAPMRSLPNSNSYQSFLAFYNGTTKEVLYEPSAYSLQVVATSGTPIVLLPPARGKTYILTGTTTQAFSTASLGTNDVGWFCIVHNGNATSGGDINLTGMTGTAIIHEQKPTQNGGSVYLYWNGTGLVGY